MSETTLTEDLLIQGRPRDLGGFEVSRVLPSTKRRHIGPFVFLDHMGPVDIDDHHAMDVRPHPHIGLATVTYLFEGRVFHRDNLGSKQVITPGDLNWMTAGRCIAHSERTPPEDRAPHGHKRTHGVQIWVALPVEHEETDPTFVHWPKDRLPSVDIAPGLSARLLLGEFAGACSPVATLSRMLFMDFRPQKPFSGELSLREKEAGLYVIAGDVRINGRECRPEDFVILARPERVSIQAEAGAHFIALGGDSFPEPRHIWWNFVSSRKERIHQAAREWKEQRFAKIDNEHEFIPLPDYPLP